MVPTEEGPVPSRRRRRRLPMLLVTGLTFLALDTAGFGPIRSARAAVLSIGRPLGSAAEWAMAPLADTWHGAVHIDRLEEENRELRRRVAEMEGRLASAPDREVELRELLDAVEIDFPLDVGTVTALVVTDRETAVGRELEIDKGANDGITEGMPVVTGTGLVGRVELVADDRAVVLPLTERDVSVGVRTRFGLGVVEGDGRGGLGLRATEDLAIAIQRESGALRLVTSGLGRSRYPAGIPVALLPAATETNRSVIGVEARADLAGVEPTGEATGPGPAGPRIAAAEAGRAAGSVGGTHRVEPLADVTDPSYLTVLLTEPEPETEPAP